MEFEEALARVEVVPKEAETEEEEENQVVAARMEGTTNGNSPQQHPQKSQALLRKDPEIIDPMLPQEDAPELREAGRESVVQTEDANVESGDHDREQHRRRMDALSPSSSGEKSIHATNTISSIEDEPAVKTEHSKSELQKDITSESLSLNSSVDSRKEFSSDASESDAVASSSHERSPFVYLPAAPSELLLLQKDCLPSPMDSEDQQLQRPNGFSKEYESYVKTGGSSRSESVSEDLAEDELDEAAGDDANSCMKACSVKLVDISLKKEAEEGAKESLKRDVPVNSLFSLDEPSPKRLRPSDEASGRLADIPASLTVVSKHHSSSSSRPVWQQVNEETKESSRVNIQDAVGKLLSPQNEGKVTISPVRAKDSKSSSERPVGSVTITKLSTGTSQCVDSKDLKTILGSGTGNSITQKSYGESNGLRISLSETVSFSSKKKSPNSYSVEVHKKQKKAAKNSAGTSSFLEHESSSKVISCSKCDDDFSTKETRKLHTCYSKLDQHFLTDSGVRTSQNPSEKSSTSSSPISSLSRGSSRSSSPLLNQQQQQQPTTTLTMSTAISSHSIKIGEQAEVKLIKDDKDALMIEGRPKLTVSKVNHKTTEIKVGTPSSVGEKKIVAKLKLAPNGLNDMSLDDSKGRASKSVTDPLNLSEDSDSNSMNCSGKRKADSQQAAPGEWTRDSSPSFTGKLKIKLPLNNSIIGAFGCYPEANGGRPTATQQQQQMSSSSGPAPGKKDEDGFAFAFAGKPTYSPSRVEPSAGLQGKVVTPTALLSESPRDASNKDSPASQADSGVFSIASSNSPSKDGATSGTSPDSPNRDRMPYPDQAYGRDMQWKSSPNHHSMHKPHQDQQQSFSGASSNLLPSSQMNFMASPRRQQHIANSQQQQQHLPPSMYGDGGMSEQAYASGGNHQQPMFQTPKYLSHEQQQEHQLSASKMSAHRNAQPQPPPPPAGMAGPRAYSYSQAFFNHNPEPPIKRKRGRPRKNPLRDPAMPKRQYVRKKKSSTPILAGEDNSVYNFDEEEMQDGLQPMRPRRATASQKKYSFGSSSDEDGIARGPRLFGPMGYSQQQHFAAMQRHHQQMQQQHYMNHAANPAMVGGDLSRNPAENGGDCSYESEPINKGTSIGIKIKIKRPPEPEKKKFSVKNEMGINGEIGQDGMYGPSRAINKDNSYPTPSSMSNSAVDPMRQQALQKQQQMQQHPMNMQSQQQQQLPPSNAPHAMSTNPGSVESNHSAQVSPNPMRSPYSSMMNSPSSGVQHGNFGNPAGPMHAAAAAAAAGTNGAMNMYNQQQQMQSQQQHFANGGVPVGAAPVNHFANMNRYRMSSPYHNMQDSNSFYPNNYAAGGMGMGYGHHRYGGHMMSPGYYGNQQQQQFMQQQQQHGQFVDHFHNGGNVYNGQGQFGGNMMYNQQVNPMQQQQQMQQHGPPRMNDVSSQQPIPPHFRTNMNMGMNPMEGNSANSSVIGSPRISPSSMVSSGMLPRVSPSMTPRQPTPLVSPQSDHSPAGSHHNSAMTPTYQSPLTPQGGYVQNPMTPASNMGYSSQVSPMTPQPLNNPRTPQSVGGGFPHQQSNPHAQLQHAQQQQQQQQVLVSPKPEPIAPVLPSPTNDDLKSPGCMMSPTANSLRKIRRPSRPETTNAANETSLVTPKQEPESLKPSNPPAFKKQVKAERPSSFKEEPAVPKPEKPEMIEMPHFEARWEELPEKTIHHILSFAVASEGSVPLLIRAAEVSKTWHEATKLKAGRRNLWTHLDLSEGRLKEKYRNDKKLESFLKRFGNVLEIKLTGWKNAVGTSTLKIISSACPNLVSLGLASCFKLSNEDLKFIGDNFPHLERIDLSNVSASSCSSRSAVSSTCLSDFIVAVGKRLTHLNISNNKMAGLPFVFKALSTHSSGLTELDISNITTTTREPIYINMEKFQKGCPKLRVLNANQTMMSLSDTPIKEQIQSPGFPQLRELHIAVDSRGYFEGLDDCQIERILKKSEKLKLLDLRGCQHVSDSCLIKLPTWDIEKLVLAGCSAASCSDDGVELMVKKWAANLVEIDVSGTTGERAVNYAVEAFAEADETKIRKLNLCRTAVGIKPLTSLLKQCPTLDYLNLTACRGLPRGMKRLYGSRELVEKLKEDITTGKFNDNDDSDD